MNLSPATVVRSAYNRVLRPRLPRKIASLNGVPVRYVRLFDATDVFPEYEAALLSAVREYLVHGARTVVVGGGQGVSAVEARRATGPHGSVTVFEGSAEQVERIEETLAINGVDDVDVRHTVVGEPVEVWGSFDAGDRIEAAELPDADALVLDCEGSEIGILSAIEAPPELVVVETHAFLDSPEADVREALRDRGYEIVDRAPQDEERGIVILVARRGGE